MPRFATRALPGSLRPPLGMVTVFAGVALVVMGIRYRYGNAAALVDRWIRDALGEPLFAPSPARTAALAIDLGGTPIVAAGLVVVLALLCLILDRGRLAVLAIVGPGIAVTATVLLKPLVGRMIAGPNLSFPSGHTAMLASAGLVAALLVASVVRAGAVAGTALMVLGGFLAGTAMAWAQIVLAAHYPTDTAGGICTAFALVPAAAWGIDRIAERRAR